MRLVLAVALAVAISLALNYTAAKTVNAMSPSGVGTVGQPLGVSDVVQVQDPPAHERTFAQIAGTEATGESLPRDDIGDGHPKKPDFHEHCETYTRCEAAKEVSPRSPEPHESSAIIETRAIGHPDSNDARRLEDEEDSHVSSSAGRAAAGIAMVSEAVAQGHEAETEARDAVGDVTNMQADEEPSKDLNSNSKSHKAAIVADIFTYFQHRAFGNVERQHTEVNCPNNSNYRSCVPSKNINNPPPQKCDVYTRCNNSHTELSTDAAELGHRPAQLKPVKIIHQKVKAAAHGHAHGHVKYGPVAYHKHLAHVIGNGNDIIHPVGHEKALPHSDDQHQIENSENQAGQDQLAAEIIEAAANEDHPHAEDLDPVEQQQGRLEGQANAYEAHA